MDPTKAEVEVYTQGRLTEGDSRTELLLAGALAAAREYCGWHVTPSKSEEIAVDGPGTPLLVLPTLRLVEIEEIADDGLVIAPAELHWSEIGLVRKLDRRCWTGKYRGVTAKITHGFDNIPAWKLAVLAIVERTAEAGREEIGPYKYFPAESIADGSAFTGSERAILDNYRLARRPW